MSSEFRCHNSDRNRLRRRFTKWQCPSTKTSEAVPLELLLIFKCDSWIRYTLVATTSLTSIYRLA